MRVRAFSGSLLRSAAFAVDAEQLMSSSRKPADRSKEDAVAALARELDLALEEVRSVYRDQMARLASQARIHDFIGTLARGNTRRILRERHGLRGRPIW